MYCVYPLINTIMKRCLLILVFSILCISLSFAQDLNSRFKLYPTQNIWTFLKLDTSTGLIWQVQFSTQGEDYRFETCLNSTCLVLDEVCPSGRFELYPTQNMYNFVLIDTQVGTTYQVQWGKDSDSRIFVPIYPHSTLVWSHGFAKQKSMFGWSFIDMKGRSLQTEYFTNCSDFENGFAEVELNEKWNLIDTSGNYLLNAWYDACQIMNDVYVHVINDAKCNLYHMSGKFISSQWYDRIDIVEEDIYRVENDGKFNLINSKGTCILPQWYDQCYLINRNIAWIKHDNMYNIIDINSLKTLSDVWFNGVESYLIDDNKVKVVVGDTLKQFDIVDRKFVE